MRGQEPSGQVKSLINVRHIRGLGAVWKNERDPTQGHPMRIGPEIHLFDAALRARKPPGTCAVRRCTPQLTAHVHVSDRPARTLISFQAIVHVEVAPITHGVPPPLRHGVQQCPPTRPWIHFREGLKSRHINSQSKLPIAYLQR